MKLSKIEMQANKMASLYKDLSSSKMSKFTCSSQLIKLTATILQFSNLYKIWIIIEIAYK